MSTPTLLETIKIENGEVFNLACHQTRCDQSRKALFHTQDTLDLASYIHPPPTGLWRCRILYAEQIRSIEYIPYASKALKRLKIVSSNLEYSYKYADRTALDTLVQAQQNFDDIIIEKEGYLTDTSIANIAFYDGTVWYTPQKPLLKGCMRAKLIDDGFLQTKAIRSDDLKDYTQVALMNAMLGFKVLKDVQIEDLQGKTYDY